MADGPRLICASAELAEGGRGVRFTVERDGEALPAFAIRFDGVAYAYVNRCGHIAVELDWQAGEFFDGDGLYLVCATHGALYHPEDGRCMGCPCRGRGLSPLGIEERDGAVYCLE